MNGALFEKRNVSGLVKTENTGISAREAQDPRRKWPLSLFETFAWC